GKSLKGIAREWNELGILTTAGKGWRHDNVRGVLLNPRNAALRAYRGEVIGSAQWPALIDQSTHEAAIALLRMPSRRTTETTARKYLLPAIAYCWKCGSDVATGHTVHGKRVYVCRASKCVSRKAEPVDELVQAAVIERLSRSDAVDLLTPETNPDLAEHRAKAAAIHERIDDLAIGLEEGLLTLAAVRKSSERLQRELQNIETVIHGATTDDVLTPLVKADNVRVAWFALDLVQKRSVITTLMRITLHSPERGHQAFKPESVEIEWKS
ncbi:MAG: recombinase family protein, partial [Nocardioides sp.]